MERRGFLAGLFGGIIGGGVIVSATDAEIARFTSPLAVGDPIVSEAPSLMAVWCGHHLYNSAGEVVALVKNIQMRGGRPEIYADCLGDVEIIKNHLRLAGTRQIVR
jgi:hypothetical protein